MKQGKPFEKGHKRLPGSGRAKGTLNKRTWLLREILAENGTNLVQEILNDLDSLDPKDRVDARLRLLPFVFPKLSSIQVESKPPEVLAIEAMSDAELTNHVKKIIGSGEEYEEAITTESTKIE